MPLTMIPYNRAKAVAYAHRWAYSRNPAYYDFSALGGDCANFTSQCLFAGGGVMNYLPNYGWYYRSLGDRTPSWSGVPFLYSFLIRNRGPGPVGQEVGIDSIQPGDVVQISFDGSLWRHSPTVVHVEGDPSPDTVYLAAHTIDADFKPLSAYSYQKFRCIHINGVRKYT